MEDRVGIITFDYVDPHIMKRLVITLSEYNGIHHCLLVFERADGSGFHFSPKPDNDEYCVFGYKSMANE